MPEIEEQDRQIEEAKASLLARMEELGRRVAEVRQKIDVKAHIAAHPWPAVGIAFAIGLLAGIPGGGKKRTKIPADAPEVKSGLIGAVVATLGSLAFALIKDVAMRQAGSAAKDWWDQRSVAGQMPQSEAERARAQEPFRPH